MILQVQAILISTGQCRDSLPPSLLCLPDPSLFLHLIRFFTTVKTLLESVSPGSMSYLPGGGGEVEPCSVLWKTACMLLFLCV